MPCDQCINGNGDPATRLTGYFGSNGEVSTVCAANVAGNPAECGSKLDNQFFCTDGACSACVEDSDYAACITEATASPQCGAFAPTVDCAALFTQHATEITETCGDGDISNQDNVLKWATYVCGPAN